MEGTAMKKILSRRPSPAMILAIIALVVALTGTAVAGGGFLTKKKFNKAAVKGPVQYVTTTASVPNGQNSGLSYVSVSATCPSGTKVVGGGIKAPDNPSELDGDVYVDDSYPTGSGWAGHVSNFDSDPSFTTTATTTAICVSVRSSVGTPPAS
jgi:hypothetical protein